MKKTYIVIPVYNEASQVGIVVEALRKQYDHVVCVNDGSKDNSADVIVASGAVLVDHPVNLGQGGALQTGIDYALQDPEAAYFVTFDADGQHEPADIPKMIRHLRNEKLDVVIGSRFLGSMHNVSPFKRWFLRAAAKYSGSVSGLTLSDPHNGLRVFNRKFAENLKITLADFTHASEIVDRIEQGKFRYSEYPVHIKYTDYSKAKGQPMLNAINIAFDLFLHRVIK